MSTSWERLTLHERIEAVNTDCMRHKDFASLGGVIMMGKVQITDHKTACTNGLDVHYGEEFIAPLNRKQLRYLVLHENGHKGFKHCTLPEYKRISKKYPRLSNQAMDYVINGFIEELDPRFVFVERPSQGLCIDIKYRGKSFIEILDELVTKEEKDGRDPKGLAEPGDGEPFDEHIDGDGEFSPEEQEEIGKKVDDALRQGEMLAKRLAGQGAGGRDIFGLKQARETDWRDALRDFIQTICVGDEQSRFCPPNKRLLASGFIMPSHFSETTGELLVACDTSGSMSPYYSALFGEVARICETVKPDLVRVVWWDTAVCGEQVFKAGDYGNIAGLLKPKGGGGTDPGCLVRYVAAKQYKPKAIVWLTDGYLDGSAGVTSIPSLWGVINNASFKPPSGKVLRIRV